MPTTKKTTGTGAGRQNGRSKSQWTRDLLTEGKTIADITRIIPNMGYAFAYGIADRFEHPDGGTYADRAASRRATRMVTVDKEAGTVTVITDLGVRVVYLATGKVTAPKAKA